MIRKIKRMLGIGTPDPMEGNTLIINVEKLERRVALLENGVIEEYTVEREGDQNIVGGIFKGRVKNIEPGLKAMFVDIGLDKNAFLHFWDALPAALDAGLEEIERDRPKKSQKRISSKDIPDIYPVGSEIIIQVSKGPIGTKGPRVTTNISLAGRYLVLMPYTDQFGISRKIEDPKERQRLRRIVQKLSVPEGMGIIMRTVAQSTRARHFVRDLAMLLEQWHEVERRRDESPPRCACSRNPASSSAPPATSSPTKWTRSSATTRKPPKWSAKSPANLAPRQTPRASHDRQQPIFEKLNIQRQIDEAFSRQVWLPCGGYIVIDETEADLHRRQYRPQPRLEDVEKMIFETNVEAAQEVARQLRLRNIGGLVVVDFIDMRHRKDQAAVYKAMKDRLKRDKAKTQVLQISPIGLMEMTRQRLNESLRETMFEPCPYCQGRGRVKTTMTMSVEIQRRLNTVIQHQREKAGDLIVVVNSDVLNRFKSEDSRLLVISNANTPDGSSSAPTPPSAREKFAIIDAATDKIIQQT